jgi:hypothetical protein
VYWHGRNAMGQIMKDKRGDVIRATYGGGLAIVGVPLQKKLLTFFDIL